MRSSDRNGGSDRGYKRGAIMGLTVAEAFILLSFVLLLLFTWWQVDAEKRSLRLTDDLRGLTEAQKADIVTGLSDGTFEMAQELRRAGLKLRDMKPITETEIYSRFMRDEDMRRLLHGAVELDPGTLLKLSEVAEIRPTTRLKTSLDTLLSPQSAAELASQRLAYAAAQEEVLRNSLELTLGNGIRAAGGQLTVDGKVILPEKVLFMTGSDVVREPDLLKQLCAAWVGTLHASSADISELKIEGHASSEGKSWHTPEQAYLYNLDLSQRRAKNALRICLEGLTASTIQDWARSRLSSAGYSSARLVQDAKGIEDREASRRVVFSMELDREKLLEGIRGDLLFGQENPATSSDTLEMKLGGPLR
ncbi:OmpA family protein [Chachezhania sediminis]|uniref:OmpA family protein n=1 Tax=Chachezhania sediminis TaxID=2599291 RepID=UPI00131AA1FC|nr:hypothetical protein [Chachezhania sediminis]